MFSSFGSGSGSAVCVLLRLRMALQHGKKLLFKVLAKRHKKGR